ncbi:NusB antitermination factor [Lachnospiraceae bacterium]|nr:NusB antitermination factor [Lachnospiraceae bacterium]
MKRSLLREHIFILVFMSEFNSVDEMPEKMRLYFESLEEPADDASEEYIEVKFKNILEKLPELDEKINEKAEGWTTSRMGKVELALIRLAAYEIFDDEDVPTSVAINEAVELAKKYGQDSAPSFVNGVLAKLVG